MVAGDYYWERQGIFFSLISAPIQFFSKIGAPRGQAPLDPKNKTKGDGYEYGNDKQNKTWSDLSF
jgi:hypothetical protein